MARKMSLFCALTAVLLPLGAGAQEEEASTPPFVYATYFECDSTREWLADAIAEQLYKPIYDEAVDEGVLSGWGYLGHHTGGKWRRVLYRVAPTVEAALNSVSAIAEKTQAANAEAAREFGTICNSHVDYLWQSVTGSSGSNLAMERGEVGFSVYMTCDEVTETDADEAFKTHGAPIYDAEVEAGNLVTWGYLQHWVGGEYRRLLTLTAPDMGKLMAARDNAVTKTLEMQEELADYFESCNSHSDYIWTIKHEKP